VAASVALGPKRGRWIVTNESNLSGWSVASPSEIERTARALVRSRDRFFSSNGWDGTLVRPLILRSWERCRALHVDATRLSAPLAVTRDAQLREVREASEPLMRAARGVIDRLSDQLVDSGYVVVLTNGAGCILNVVGDRAILRRLARIDFVAGGDWSEAAAGTNAIGTALSDRASVQLLGSEHFCEGWTDLTCTAVPIRDPRSGDVIGVLDITGDYRLIRAHLTNLLAISVLEIEERLRQLHESERGLARSLNLLRPVPESGTWPRGVPLQPEAPKPKPEREFVDDNVLLTFASGSIGASLDLAATIRTVAEQTEALLKAQGTAVVLFPSEHETQYHVWSQSAGHRDDGLAAALERCEAPAALQERGEPIIADDIAAAPIFGEIGAFEPFRSIALLPLPTARGTIGFVAAARRTVTPWGFADLRRAFALMSGAATAIDNALLFESLRKHNRHIEAINAVAQLLGKLLEPAEHLEEILRKIVETLAFDGGVLYLRSGEGGALERAASYGVLGPFAEPSGGGAHFSAALCAGTKDLGVLKIFGHGGSLPTFSDRATIAAIAQQVAMAIKNAQLLQTAHEVEVLRRADRLKSEFLATVSHDLRSPLTAICAGIDGMRDHPGGAQVDDGLLNTIWNQADRLGRLVDQLLDISQIERGGLRLDCEWHDLRALLDDVREGLEPLYGRDRIVINVSSPHPLLFVDRDRFIQMLYNLVDNACKYSPPHKPVTLEATWTSDQITLGVVDCGPGILEREREHIFKRFYRGDGAGGTMRSIGLGLAICRGIVEAHGGTIWLEGGSSAGCVFRVRIPLRSDFGWDLQ
jgi:signal transduction histidine kinase